MKKLLLIVCLIILTGIAIEQFSEANISLAEAQENIQGQSNDPNLESKCSNSCLQDESKIVKCSASRIIEKYIEEQDLEANNYH